MYSLHQPYHALFILSCPLAISEFMSVPVFDPSTIFVSKQEAVASIAEKNIVDKKPYKVVRSSNDRYMVTCKTDECCYKVNIRKRADGLFHVSSYHEHTCTNIFAKLATNWVRSKAKALIVNRRRRQLKKEEIERKLEAVFGEGRCHETTKVMTTDMIVERIEEMEKKEEQIEASEMMIRESKRKQR